MMVTTWKDIEALRDGEQKPSSGPIRTNKLAFIDGSLCQQVTMRGGAGESYWVQVPTLTAW